MNVVAEAFIPPETFDAPPHATVLRDETRDAIAPRPGGVYVDATLGGGGHTEALLDAEPGCRVIAFDRDERAIAIARERLERFGERVTFVHSRFSRIGEHLAALGVPVVDGIVADLGLSSIQLDDPTRGMSFRAEGPLDMRMDETEGETALELVARLDANDLADLIYDLGEEKSSRRIARRIKQAEEAGELVTTLDLRRAVVRAVGPARVGGVDPATRTFQALRIAVNRELDELAELLEAAPRLVALDGRVAIISFHSLEDRIVKRALSDASTWDRLTSKPVVASESEVFGNPRARSAKLRVARKVAS